MVLQVLIYGLITGTQVLLLALALYCVHLVSKVINLALGAIGAVVAYALYFAFVVCSWPLWTSILFAIAIALILGFINYLLNEPMTKKQQPLLALVISFATAFGLEAIIAMLFGAGGKSLIAGILTVITFGIYQIPVSGLLILIFGLLAIACALFAYFFTPIGRIFRAISENHFSAFSLGINQPRIRLYAYLAAAIIAGVIGALSGLNTVLVPTMGFNLIAMAFMALLVGGVNDLRGTIIASYIIAFIPELVIGFTPTISANWRLSLVFLIATILLILRPHGLFNRQQRLS